LRNRLPDEPARLNIVTMRDVAEQSGVSVTTVSHVINNTRPVNPETRTRVEQAMQVLGYQPNVLARSLRRGKTQTIGIILPDNANPYFADVVRGIEDTSFDQGYSVVLCNSDNDLDKEHLYTNVLIEKQVDGIIFVAAGLSEENIKNLQKRGVPSVLVDRQVPGVQIDSVFADNRSGGFLATNHLVDLDHIAIACITGPQGVRSSVERVAGYHQALEAAGLPANPDWVVEGDFQYQSGYAAAEQLLNSSTPPSAIFACNDLMAIGAYRYAFDNQLRIPQDISIIGFDDIRLAEFTNPPLTTIHQSKGKMGAKAAELLLGRITNGHLGIRQEVVGVQLVVRGSTARKLKITMQVKP
jgi:LacI family transcriptional regulator